VSIVISIADYKERLKQKNLAIYWVGPPDNRIRLTLNTNKAEVKSNLQKSIAKMLAGHDEW